MMLNPVRTISTLGRAALLAIAALVTVASAASNPARAQLAVDVTRGSIEPLRIAIPEMLGSDADGQRYGRDIAGVVTSDLGGSGLFAPVDPGAFLQSPQSLAEGVRFEDWKTINAPALVTGNVRRQAGQLVVEFRLWDTFAGQQMAGRSITAPEAEWRRIAHIIADAVYERLTGESGYFDTKIVYVAETGPATQRVKRLAVMDQDGANNRYLTDGSALVLTPRFSPSSQEIAYMAYFGGRPRVYVQNLVTGSREVLGDFPGMMFSPRFSPDGGRVIMTLEEGGNSDIYVMNRGSRAMTRLTDHPAIDTSPSYSPDGSRIVFNSDRGGTQQIYVMNADGSGVSRISFGDGRYGTPVWSPRGDLIAFTKIQGGRFQIGVMGPDGSGERILAESFLDEAPTWAPNGRVLMFYRQTPSSGSGGRARLYSVDLTGFNLKEIPTPTDASDPAWSPLLP